MIGLLIGINPYNREKQKNEGDSSSGGTWLKDVLNQANTIEIIKNVTGVEDIETLIINEQIVKAVMTKRR